MSAGSEQRILSSAWSCAAGGQRFTARDLDSRNETEGMHEGMWASMACVWQESLQKRVILHAAFVHSVSIGWVCGSG